MLSYGLAGHFKQRQKGECLLVLVSQNVLVAYVVKFFNPLEWQWGISPIVPILAHLAMIPRRV